jgi:hypothetical protein
MRRPLGEPPDFLPEEPAAVELISARLQYKLSSATIPGFEDKLPKMHPLNGIIQSWLRATLAYALIVGSIPSDTLAQSRRGDAGIGTVKMSFLSQPRDDAERPAELAPRSTAPQDNTGFDGAWIFTSAGCRYTGSLPAKIVGGKIIVKGGSGQVDPDGTLHSVGAGNGMTLTAVGRLTGNTGAGTFSRSDGCVGSWIAIKR